MAFFNAIANSVLNFSKNCYDDIKSNSPKYQKAFSNLGIDSSRIRNGVSSVRDVLAKNMKMILEDREGNLIKLKSNVREAGQNLYSQLKYGENYEQHLNKKETKNNREKDNVDIGENDL